MYNSQSRSRRDFDGKGNTNFSLAEIGFHHKFEKDHTGADPKHRAFATVIDSISINQPISLPRYKIQKIKQQYLSLT